MPRSFAITDGGVKILIGLGSFIILFLPDTFGFPETNVFNRRVKKMEADAKELLFSFF